MKERNAKDISIDKLIVNPDNYRFRSVDNEDQAIKIMMDEKGIEIYNLAEHICINGLDEAKKFRVLKQDDNYIVLDGNRRLTAVKCLSDPNLIQDDKLRRKFESLSKNYEDRIDQIPSVIYTDEKEARVC